MAKASLRHSLKVPEAAGFWGFPREAAIRPNKHPRTGELLTAPRTPR